MKYWKKNGKYLKNAAGKYVKAETCCCKDECDRGTLCVTWGELDQGGYATLQPGCKLFYKSGTAPDCMWSGTTGCDYASTITKINGKWVLKMRWQAGGASCWVWTSEGRDGAVGTFVGTGESTGAVTVTESDTCTCSSCPSDCSGCGANYGASILFNGCTTNILGMDGTSCVLAASGPGEDECGQYEFAVYCAFGDGGYRWFISVHLYDADRLNIPCPAYAVIDAGPATGCPPAGSFAGIAKSVCDDSELGGITVEIGQ